MITIRSWSKITPSLGIQVMFFLFETWTILVLYTGQFEDWIAAQYSELFMSYVMRPFVWSSHIHKTHLNEVCTVSSIVLLLTLIGHYMVFNTGFLLIAKTFSPICEILSLVFETYFEKIVRFQSKPSFLFIAKAFSPICEILSLVFETNEIFFFDVLIRCEDND